MDSTLDPAKPDRAAELIQQWATVLPTAVIAAILKLKVTAVNRLKKKLGLAIGLKEGKRITSQFLSRAPDLSSPGLTEEERNEIRLIRLEWLTRRQKAYFENERASDVIAFCSTVLPTQVLAELCGMSREAVISEQKERGVGLDRSKRRTIEQRFDSSDFPPRPSLLTAKEMGTLKSLWAKRHEAYLAVKQRRYERSLLSAKAQLERMKAARLELLNGDAAGRLPMGEEKAPCPSSRCSGNCGESWPRTNVFFVSNWRSADHLADRCKFCTTISRLHARHEKPAPSLRKRKRGRILSAPERLRALEVVRLYGRAIPKVLLRNLFRLSQESLARLFREAEVSVTAAERHRIFWRWHFQRPPPDLPGLSESERARLHLASIKLRELVESRFLPNEEHRQLLEREAELFRKEVRIRNVERTPPEVREYSCRICGRCYPRKKSFFKIDGRKLRPICKVCANHRAQLKRRGRLELRFG